MKKILKFLGIFILVILLAVISIPFIFKDKIVETVKEQVNNQLNAKVNFGEFDLSIISTFPNLLFEINNVEVVGVDKFEKDTLFKINKFDAKIDIKSVFGDNIKVLAINLDNPKINAIVLQDSTANWDIAKADTSATQQQEENDDNTENDSSSNIHLALKSFTINNADIYYTDNTANMSASIEGLNFELSGDLGADKTLLQLKTLIKKLSFKQDGITLLNKTEIEYNAGIDADLESSKYTFKDNKFRINELILSFAGFVQMADNDDINLDLKFNTNNPTFKSLLSLVPGAYTKDFKDVKTSGSLKLEGFAKGTYNENQLPAFNLTLLVNNAKVQYPDLPSSIDNININLNIDNKDGVEDHTVIDLRKFDMAFAGNNVNMKVLTKTPISDPYVNGEVKANVDFSKLKQAVPLEDMELTGTMNADLAFAGNMSSIEKEQYQDFKANGDIALNNFVYKSPDMQDVNISQMQMKFSPEFVSLDKFDVTIGKSDISAVGRIDNMLMYYFKDEVLKGSFSVQSNNLDLNELTADNTTSEEEANVTEQTSQDTISANTDEPLTVVELPKNIDFSLNADFHKVLYDNMEIENIKGEIKLSEGIAYMNNLNMNMLDGSMKMNGYYSSKDITKPQVDFEMDIINFDIPKTYSTFNTVQHLAPISQYCEGKFSMGLKINTLLNDTMYPVLSSLNGEGAFSSKNIKINNSDLFNQISTFLKSDKYKNPELKDVNVKFEIKDGNIEIKPFTTKMNNSEITLGGKQGIDSSIDYDIDLKIPSKDLGNQANALMGSLAGIAQSNGVNVKVPEIIDIKGKIVGTVDKPKLKLNLKQQTQDVGKQIEEQVKEKLKEEVDKAKQKAIEEAKKQAEKIIAEANKKADDIERLAHQTAKDIRTNASKAAAKIRSEADKQAKELIKQAGSNPLKQAAAKESAKQLRKQADIKAKKVEQEGERNAQKTINEAKKQADSIRKNAKKQADDLIKKAENA